MDRTTGRGILEALQVRLGCATFWCKLAERKGSSSIRRVLVILLGIVGCGPASAEDAPLVPPGGDWKVIAADRSMITSECIGSNETAECLTDSSVACQMLSRGYLKADICWTTPGLSRLPYGPTIKYEPEAIYYYRLDFWRITEEAARSHNALASEMFHVRPGDLAVDVYIRSLQPETECMEALNRRTAYVPASVCPRTRNLDHFYLSGGYLVLTATLFMRTQSDRWQNFHVYTDFSYGNQDEDLWSPDHWKVK